MAFTRKEQERITFLSLLSSASNLDVDPYDQAQTWLAAMIDDGFFEEVASAAPKARSPQRSGGSRQQGSGSRSRTSGGRSDGDFSNLQGAITDRQISKIIELSDGDYSEGDLADFSKQEASDLIEQLMG